ncbi:hypothetical protein [Chlorobium phaeobacteroides]|uniref:hypothetical protein n=1 Tax=Chlorobium phaeobacteroides TaxID=1096 RepID=UPI0037C06DD3
MIIRRVDRLGCSLRGLIDIFEQLQKWGVGFRSGNDGGTDTTKFTGELLPVFWDYRAVSCQDCSDGCNSSQA